MFEAYSDLMSIGDVQEALYISKNKVYDLLNSGELKGAFRIGRVWKIPRECVENYVRERAGLRKGN